MEIEYLDEISLEDYKNILTDASYKVLSDKQILTGLKNTMFISACKCDGKMVGVARLVGDYSTTGLLTNVIVIKDYRHLGIGRTLVENIKNKVYDMLEDGEQFHIELMPVYGRREFYLNCGFRYRPEKMDGMDVWIKKGIVNDK